MNTKKNWNTIKEKTNLYLAETGWSGDTTTEWRDLIKFVEDRVSKTVEWIHQVNAILFYHSVYLSDTNPSSKYTLFVAAVVKTIEEEMDWAKSINDEKRKIHEFKYKNIMNQLD